MLPENYDLNQTAANLDIDFWDSVTFTDTDLPSPDDVVQTSAVGLDFWEDFLAEEPEPETSVESQEPMQGTAAESQEPVPGTSAGSRPSSPSLLAKPRRFLAERDDKT